MMIVVEVCGQEPPGMSLMQDDHMVQALAADTPDQSLDIRILPWTAGGNQHFLNAHVAHALPKGGPVNAVAIAQQISRGLVPRKGVHDLLSRPLGRGVLR